MKKINRFGLLMLILGLLALVVSYIDKLARVTAPTWDYQPALLPIGSIVLVLGAALWMGGKDGD